jgi:hypothetical protein
VARRPWLGGAAVADFPAVAAVAVLEQCDGTAELALGPLEPVDHRLRGLLVADDVLAARHPGSCGHGVLLV